MKTATIIFPHQLFKHHPALSKEREVFLVEEQLFFSGVQSSLQFHKKKLVLHRASMQAYKKRLDSQGYRVHYIEFGSDLFQLLIKNKIEEIWFSDPVDRLLESKFKKEVLKSGMDVHRLPTPGFLTPEDWLFSFFKDARHFSMTHFYIAQRKRLKILVKGDNPIGGKWSFDPENRRKIPKHVKIPAKESPQSNRFIEEAKKYVEKHFPRNPGSVEDFFCKTDHRMEGVHAGNLPPERRRGEKNQLFSAQKETMQVLLHRDHGSRPGGYRDSAAHSTCVCPSY